MPRIQHAQIVENLILKLKEQPRQHFSLVCDWLPLVITNNVVNVLDESYISLQLI